MGNRVQKMMPFAGLFADAQTSDVSPLDTLSEIAKSEGICLSYIDLSGAPQKLLGLYLIDPELGPTIILDDSLQSDDVLHAAVLAEEIGHHFTKVTSVERSGEPARRTQSPVVGSPVPVRVPDW